MLRTSDCPLTWSYALSVTGSGGPLHAGDHQACPPQCWVCRQVVTGPDPHTLIQSSPRERSGVKHAAVILEVCRKILLYSLKRDIKHPLYGGSFGVQVMHLTACTEMKAQPLTLGSSLGPYRFTTCPSRLIRNCWGSNIKMLGQLVQ